MTPAFEASSAMESKLYIYFSDFELGTVYLFSRCRMTQEQLLITRMFAGAPLIFVIGKPIDFHLDLARQLGYYMTSTPTTQREQAGKCIHVFESDPFPIIHENYNNSIEVFYL
jgi:hypothetical protein